MLHLFEIGEHVIAKTFMNPIGSGTIYPGMKGVVIERQEVVKRHKVRFDPGQEVWATSDQIKLDPAFQKDQEKKEVAAVSG